MIYVNLPDDKEHRLSFYLAMEEYIARNKEDGDYFFMWQVEPSVIFGRNQLIETEVNIEYCKEKEIRMYRRKSGGGCVYADKSNVMFSYITSDENVNFTFNRYLNYVALMLLKMGVEATVTGRNDILIEGKKVSGNAFYHLPGRSIVHGTMLYDTDMEYMINAISPADDKLKSKGVESVRQHIALLKDYTTMSIGEFKQHARSVMCEKEVILTEQDVIEISKIEEGYLSDSFIYGNNPAYTKCSHKRIDGVGELEIRLEIKNNVIRDVNLLGDYFLVGDVDIIVNSLRSVNYNRGAINEALPDNIEDIIRNLKKEQLVSLILCENSNN